MDAQKPAPKKKPYSKPHLEIYGSLGEITGTVGKTGMADGGATPNTMTKP